MVVVRGKIRDDIDGIAERPRRRVVGVSPDFELSRQRRARIRVVCIRHVHVIVARPFEQVWMQGHPEQPFVPARAEIDVAHRDGQRHLAVNRVQPADPA